MKKALVAIALLVPAPASAATTYTVGPGQKIADALAVAGDGDTIHVGPGTYTEQPLTVAHAVRIEGEAGTVVVGSDASQPLFTVTHDGAAIASLTASAAAKVVLSKATDVVLDGVSLTRTSGADDSVVAVDATPATGTTTISRSLIANATGGSGHASPAVLGGPANNLAISDSVIVSGAGEGPALRFAGGSADSLVRSNVAALASGSDAVQVQSTTTGAKHLAIDSSILSGGAGAASLSATTFKGLLSPTGDIGIQVVHATIAGSATAIATTVDTSGVGIGTPGAISVSADRSIVRGAVGTGVTVTSSDTSTADVFVDAAAKNFHLRADAPVIDQGGPAVGGESDGDIDGQPRVAGAASDLGADEFVNRAPVGRLATPATVRTPAPVRFDASGSQDPEAAVGGGIRSFHVDFGDGSSAESPTPAITHAYARPGTYDATVTVTDAQGLAGAPSDPVRVHVVDGIAPTIRVISPRGGKSLRRRGPIRFTGSATDESGVPAVALTLRRIGTSKTSRFRVRVQQGIWSYRVPKRLKLRAGRYELKAQATDSAGNASRRVTVRFRLK